MGFLKNVLIGLLIAIIGVFVAKNFIAKAAVEGGVKVVTGLPLHIDKFNVGILDTLIDIQGFKLSNPKGFEDKTMADIPQIYVDYNLGDIIGGNIHLEAIKLHLNEFVVVKNKDGALNLDTLTALQPEAKEGEAAPKKEEKKDGEAPQIQIDVFELKVGKVIYKDYTKSKPSVKEFPLNINEQFTDITNPEALVKIIVFKALTGTTIGRLTNFDMSGLTSGIGDTLANSKQMVGEFAGQATEQLGKAADDAKKAAGEAADKLKDAAKDVNLDKAKDMAGEASKDVSKAAGAAADKTKEAAAAVGDSAKKLTSGFLNKVKSVTE